MTLKAYCCEFCGNTNLTFKTQVRWDINKQSLLVCDIEDMSAWCDYCEAETEFFEITIGEQK